MGLKLNTENLLAVLLEDRGTMLLHAIVIQSSLNFISQVYLIHLGELKI